MAEKKTFELTLGWKLSKGFDPVYWLLPKPRPGKQRRGHLVKVPAPEIARNTIIIAQSGSGKSFFLGRYLEEVVLKTSSRVLVLDPNSDFRKVGDVAPASRWTEAGYDPELRHGFLPDEESRDLFVQPWDAIDKTVYSYQTKGAARPHPRIRLNWYRIAIEWLFEDVSPTLRNEIRSCHEYFQKVFELLDAAEPGKRRAENVTLSCIEDILGGTIDLSRKEAEEKLRLRFPPAPSVAAPSAPPAPHARPPTVSFEAAHYDAGIRRAAICNGFIKEESKRAYFNVAQDLVRRGLVYFALNDDQGPNPNRLEVVDLPSIKNPRLRAIVVSHLLEQELNLARERWQAALEGKAEADPRVPTFIVVDEAHNFVVAKAQNELQERLQEQFRIIAAEGRKFGLFLILVSQRPDKLDPWVLSEFENRAIMKIGSDIVLQKTIDLLGLSREAAEMAEACLHFDQGRALLVGNWAGDKPTFLYAAARRTIDSGRNLREAHWAQPVPKLMKFKSVRDSHSLKP